MEPLETRNFVFEGREFKLRLFGTNSSYTVIAFLGQQQISPSYSVDFITHIDYFIQHKSSLIEHLFDVAESDIEQGMYFRV